MSQENRKQSIRRIFRKKNNVKFSSNTEFIQSSRDDSFFDKKEEDNKFRKLFTSDGYKHHQLKSDRKGVLGKSQQDEDISQTLNQIQERGAAFYRLGFNSLEKGAKEKKIFSDFFNLKYKDIKGTMSTGQLWSNKDRSNFLKENKIYLNKVKLLQKIALFKRNEFKKIKKFESGKNIFGSMGQIMNLGTYSHFGTTKSFAGQNSSKKNLVKNLNEMRSNLADLHSTSSRGSKLQIIVKDLQGESENWQKLEDKYFQKLIQMF